MKFPVLSVLKSRLFIAEKWTLCLVGLLPKHMWELHSSRLKNLYVFTPSSCSGLDIVHRLFVSSAWQTTSVLCEILGWPHHSGVQWGNSHFLLLRQQCLHPAEFDQMTFVAIKIPKRRSIFKVSFFFLKINFLFLPSGKLSNCKLSCKI